MTQPVQLSGPPGLSNNPRTVTFRFFSSSGQLPRYVHKEVRTEVIHVPSPAPANVRVTLEIVREDNAYFARIPEIDVAGEGDSPNDAFRSVLAAARSWLEYLNEETPDLVAELEPQRRYLPLLRAPLFSWFRDIKFSPE